MKRTRRFRRSTAVFLPFFMILLIAAVTACSDSKGGGGGTDGSVVEGPGHHAEQAGVPLPVRGLPGRRKPRACHPRLRLGIVGLELAANGVSFGAPGSQNENTLLMDCVVRGSPSSFSSDGSGYNNSVFQFLFNVTTYDIDGTSYMPGRYLAFVGCDLDHTGDGHHTIRVAGAHNVLLKDSILRSTGEGDAITANRDLQQLPLRRDRHLADGHQPLLHAQPAASLPRHLLPGDLK